MTLPLMANAARIWKRSNTSSIRQKPTRFPYSCHAQFGTSGIGAPPAGGVRTVRGMVSRGFHSSTFTITHTTRRAPPGSTSRGRSFIAEYEMRSEEHTSELQSRLHLVCRLLLEKKKKSNTSAQEI